MHITSDCSKSQFLQPQNGDTNGISFLLFSQQLFFPYFWPVRSWWNSPPSRLGAGDETKNASQSTTFPCPQIVDVYVSEAGPVTPANVTGKSVHTVCKHCTTDSM